MRALRHRSTSTAATAFTAAVFAAAVVTAAVGCSLVVAPELSQPLGAECTSNGHCASGLCHEGVCAASCDERTSCPADGVCDADGICRLPIPDADGELRVGFLYVGPVGDHGWTYAHDQARRAAEDQLPFLRTHYQESVDTVDAPAVIEQMIAEGDEVIVAASHDFLTAVQTAALNHPEIRFLLCSGFVTGPNLGSYFGRMYQAKYLAGMVAGSMTTTGRVGYLGPAVLPETVRHVNAFTLGVRAVNPDAIVQVEWVHSWYDVVEEQRLTKKLLVDGCDVVAAATDTTIPQATVDQNQPAEGTYYSIGYDNEDACGKYPDTCLIMFYWNWAPLYERLFSEILAGSWAPHENPWEQIGRDPSASTVYLAPIHPDVPDAVRVDILGHLPSLAGDDEESRQRPFVGPLRDVDGAPVLASGELLTDEQLLQMCWFVEGVVDAAGAPGEVPPACRGEREAP